MALLSTNFANSTQDSPANPLQINANLDQTPLIVGFEWNVQHHIGQIDLTWWTSWFDLGYQTWKSAHATKSLFKSGNSDYYDFYNSFNSEGFSLVINLSQHGDTSDDCLVDGKPQYIRIQRVKVDGF